MKKVHLLVAVFLVGITTQTFAQRHQNVVINPGNEHRYYNSQEIRFVEDGVLYQVATDGSFTFTEMRNGIPYYKSRRNHRVNNYNVAYGGVYHNNGRRGFAKRITTDRFGNVIGIGRTCITYNRRGFVKQIGSVPLFYQRGQLLQVGNLSIKYNRFGEIRDTKGIVNRFNKRLWHDDWYTYDRSKKFDWDDNHYLSYDDRRKKRNKRKRD